LDIVETARDTQPTRVKSSRSRKSLVVSYVFFTNRKETEFMQ
jgi:hypothetical protein